MTEYALTLPASQAAFTDKEGRLTTAGRASLNEMIRRLQTQIDGLQTLINAIIELETGQSNITDVLALKADKAQVAKGSGSIVGGGTLANPVILSLQGDQANPGARVVYGTDDDGNKGWMSLTLVSVGNASTLNSQLPAFYLARANHTGSQATSTITGLDSALALLAPLNSPTLTTPSLSGLGNYVDDTAASGGGVPVGGVYRNGSVLMIRVT